MKALKARSALTFNPRLCQPVASGSGSGYWRLSPLGLHLDDRSWWNADGRM